MSDSGLIRIMTVDDHALLRSGIAGLVNAEPDMKLVAEAANGFEAIKQFRQHRPDITLMDLQMPVMDGYIATQRIREWEGEHQAKPVPIIALTAYALQSEIDKTKDAGFTAYLTKPVRQQKLLEAIEKYGRARLDRVKPS